MTPLAEYWRDRLVKIHAWAIATEMVLIGWIATTGDLINFNKTQGDGGANPSHDAWGFIIGFVVANCFYQFIVWWIYHDRLQGEEFDKTMIPQGAAHVFMMVRAFMVLAVLLYAATG